MTVPQRPEYSWSFCEHFRWTPPARAKPKWDNVRLLIDAAHARHRDDLARLWEWLNANDARLKDIGGDPLREAWVAFRPLRLSREEDWSDWLAHLIETSHTGAFWSAALRNKYPRDALANPVSVRREWVLPNGYRADLGIELRDDSWIHLEVKIGDDDLKKTVDTGEAMRDEVGHDRVDDVLLLPADDRPLWDAVIVDLTKSGDQGARRASAVTVIDWRDVARGLRYALAESGETLRWRVLARMFCGAVEQALIGLPMVGRDCKLESLSLLDVEHLVQYWTAHATGT